MTKDKAIRLLGIVHNCLRLLRLKNTLDKVREETQGFEQAYSREYAELLDEFERELDRVETEEELDRLRDKFASAALLLMNRELRKRMAAAVRRAWRNEDEVALEELLEDRDTLALEAIETSYNPRLAKASRTERDSLVQKLSAFGSYGMLYAGMVWAAFWMSHVKSGPKEARYLWEGNLDENTCGTCQERIGQEYTANTLPGFPGDGTTICNGNCRCILEEK